ncbi:putative hypothetical protein [Streptomyces sp. NBRC 110611]|nr:putative hypothetical protein [Streptomyces sp. NBRC 110611]
MSCSGSLVDVTLGADTTAMQLALDLPEAAAPPASSRNFRSSETGPCRAAPELDQVPAESGALGFC